MIKRNPYSFEKIDRQDGCIDLCDQRIGGWAGHSSMDGDGYERGIALFTVGQT